MKLLFKLLLAAFLSVAIMACEENILTSQSNSTIGDTFDNDSVPGLSFSGTLPTIASGNASSYPLSGICIVDGGDVTITIGTPDVVTVLPCSEEGTFSGVANSLSGVSLNPPVITVAQGAVTASPGIVPINDQVAPSAPAVTAPTDGGYTTDDTPTVSGEPGSAEAGSTITVNGPSGESCTAIVEPDGSYSCDLSPALPSGGPHILSVTETDIAGNTSLPTTLEVIIGLEPFTIQGIVLDGNTLSVADYGKDFGVTSGHQWVLDGVAITGATGTTYIVTAADEEGLITLKLDGTESQNSLLTSYAVYSHENNATIINSAINGSPVVYENLVNTIDLGSGSLRFNSGANQSFSKRASSQSLMTNIGDSMVVSGGLGSFSTYVVGFTTVPTASAQIVPTRLRVGRGANSGNYQFHRNGDLVYSSPTVSSGVLAGPYTVKRVFGGYELSVGGTVLYTD